KLVDYDGMFVPALAGWQSHELGHRNYQHPLRSHADFDARLDNFSAWVIYTSLVALSIDASLWKQLKVGDECLLFHQKDFLHPARPKAFYLLENHSKKTINARARKIRYFLSLKPSEVLFIDEPVAEPVDLPELDYSVDLFEDVPAEPQRECLQN